MATMLEPRPAGTNLSADFVAYPVSSWTVLAAVAVTFWGHVLGDPGALVLNRAAFGGEPWRIVTSTLFHGDVLHLLFNAYWMTVLGRWVEAYFGRARTLGLVLLLAVVPACAEYAFVYGGIGLSGVVYGIFGLLWVAGRRCRSLRPALPNGVKALFVAWFFVCIALTHLEVWRIGNVAHGAGCLFGALLGFALTAPRRWAAPRWSLVGAVTLAACIAATVGRPFVNVTTIIEEEWAYEAHQAAVDEDWARASALFERALERSPERGDWWARLGVTRFEQQRPDAGHAFDRATELDPSEAYAREVLGWWWAAEAGQADDWPTALRLLERSVAFHERDADTWRRLGEAYLESGRSADAVRALERSLRLDGDDAKARALLARARADD